MRTMTEHAPTISDYINQLIRPRKHTVTIPGPNGTTRTHTTHHPPLLDELDNNTTTAKVGVEKAHGDPRSKPAGRLDAVALLHRIDKDADTISRRISSRRIGTLTQRLSSISGTIADTDPDTIAWAKAKIRGWVIGAQVITGWDTAPFTPDVPCPDTECERRGSIRIRVEDQVAYCVECGYHWGPSDILQLGQYVSWASEHLRGPRHWLTDPEGFPTECIECLAARQEMADRAAERRHKDDTKRQGVA